MQEFTPDTLDLARWIRPGDLVTWTHATGEPRTLTEILVQQRHALRHPRVLLGTLFSKTLRPEHADAFTFLSFGAVGYNRDFCKAGVVEVVPTHLSELPTLFQRGVLRPDVVFVQVPPERQGRFSFGVVNMYIAAAVCHARVVIAEVNEQMPWTHGNQTLDVSRVDALVRTSRPLVQIPRRALAPLDQAIALHVVPLIPDGAVLQVGIGGVPSAVLAKLRNHRDLGLHGGVMGDDVLIELIETGVLTNAKKHVDTGVSVTGGLFGTDRLYAFANDNPALRVDPVEYTHNPTLAAGFECFVTLNSAIEVDLTGQVNGETAGRDYLGTIGGQTDFIRGALASPRGRSIIMLPSTVERSGQSRVVAQLGKGVTTTARADADVIVTEHGVAELRGRSIRERVRAMLAIADPSQREVLEHEARELVAGYT